MGAAAGQGGAATEALRGGRQLTRGLPELCACCERGAPPTRASSTVAMALSGKEASVSAVNSASVHSAIMAVADTVGRRQQQEFHFQCSCGSSGG